MNFRHCFPGLACLILLATGAASGSYTLTYVDLPFKPPIRGVQPAVRGSINGVPGYFVIDTGAMSPILTQSAVQRCGIATTPSEGVAEGVGGKVPMLQATNVTIYLTPEITLHWRKVLVLPKGDTNPSDVHPDIFGLLDYHTLESAHAVIDMTRKTVTLTK